MSRYFYLLLFLLFSGSYEEILIKKIKFFSLSGGFGVDFSHDVTTVEKGVTKVAKCLLAYGVTSFCPTLVTSANETYAKVLPKIKKRSGGAHGATILGVHVEGPFINPIKKGAHEENCIKKFDNVRECDFIIEEKHDFFYR